MRGSSALARVLTWQLRSNKAPHRYAVQVCDATMLNWNTTACFKNILSVSSHRHRSPYLLSLPHYCRHNHSRWKHKIRQPFVLCHVINSTAILPMLPTAAAFLPMPAWFIRTGKTYFLFRSLPMLPVSMTHGTGNLHTNHCLIRWLLDPAAGRKKETLPSLLIFGSVKINQLLWIGDCIDASQQ